MHGDVSAETALSHLWDALQPLHAQVVAAGGGERVVYAVQARPLAVQVIKRAERDFQPRRIAFVDPVAFAEDGGAALASAVDEWTAVAVAAQEKPEVGAALAIGDEVTGDGGLVLVADPMSGGAELKYAAHGVPLDQAVTIVAAGVAMRAH